MCGFCLAYWTCLSLPQPMIFLTFPLCFSSPSHWSHEKTGVGGWAVCQSEQQKSQKNTTFPCLFNYILEWPSTTISLLSQKSDVAMWDLPMSNRSFIVIFYFLLEKQMASFAHIKSNPSLELKLIICHDFHIPCAYRNTNYLVTHLTILPNIFTYNSGWRCNREKWFILMTTIQH